VMAGMGVSFLSAHTVSRELASGSLCVLDVEDFPLMLHWYVVHLRDKRLLREPFVVREKGSDTWQSMQEGFGAHIDRLNIAMQIKSTETIKQAVMAGLGLGFLSAHTIAQELRTGSLKVLDVRGFPLMLNWYVVHRRHKRLPPVAQAFKDFLLNEGATLIAQTMG